MTRSMWTICPDPIIFYDDGNLCNGQHRLFAVSDSGTTQQFIVLRGLPREAALNIDMGKTRSVVDNAKISGADPELTDELISVCRMIEEGERQHVALSNSQKLGYVALHREAGKWACSHGPRGRGMRNAMALAAVARAWYHESDKERLRRFCQVMSNGQSEGAHESAAVAFRNFLIQKAATGGRYGAKYGHRELFLKCMNVIHYFMRGRKLMVIKSIEEEVYPLPNKRKGVKVEQRNKTTSKAPARSKSAPDHRARV